MIEKHVGKVGIRRRKHEEQYPACTCSRNGLKVYISFLPIVSAKEKTTYRTIRQSQQIAKEKEVAAVASSSGIRMGI
jgi:hypothetical protein